MLISVPPGLRGKILRRSFNAEDARDSLKQKVVTHLQLIWSIYSTRHRKDGQAVVSLTVAIRHVEPMHLLKVTASPAKHPAI